jgi:hypothetical protein
VEAWRGFHSRIRATQMGLTLDLGIYYIHSEDECCCLALLFVFNHMEFVNH